MVIELLTSCMLFAGCFSHFLLPVHTAIHYRITRNASLYLELLFWVSGRHSQGPPFPRAAIPSVRRYIHNAYASP